VTRTVVVAVDWSPVSKRAVEFAGEIATAMKARLVLLHVRAPEGRPPVPAIPTGAASEGELPETLASEWSARVKSLGVADVRVVFLEGPPVDALLGYVEAHPPDLLVFGRRGHSSGTRMLLGGVASSVLQHATCPLLVVP
jgi:nucleotide-binding universal stress UspA family protein